MVYVYKCVILATKAIIILLFCFILAVMYSFPIDIQAGLEFPDDATKSQRCTAW